MSELKTIGNELLTADLKARIAELEELQFEHLVSAERIKVLEAENAELKRQLSPLSSATPSYVAGLEAERDKWEADAIQKLNDYSCAMIDKKMLEAERDELKFKYKHWRARYEGQYKMTQELRARHAALVKAARPTGTPMK